MSMKKIGQIFSYKRYHFNSNRTYIKEPRFPNTPLSERPRGTAPKGMSERSGAASVANE